VLKCHDIVQDGGFEVGPFSSAWVRLSQYELIIGERPRTGRYGAWLGGYHNAQDVLYQRVTIPPDVIATLSLWWYVVTTEGEHPHDSLRIEMRDVYGDLLGTLFTIDDGDHAGTWTPADLDVSAYAGQTVRIAFEVVTDDSRVTDFFVDDVSLTVCSRRPAAPRPGMR
jgi:hypothetical protein